MTSAASRGITSSNDSWEISECSFQFLDACLLQTSRIALTNQRIFPILPLMKKWITDYIQAQKAAHDSIPVEAVAQLIEKLGQALREGRQVLVFGNGGSAANSSHFATDLGKGASDKVGKRFRVLSLTDNVSWMTALGNDYSYEDIFVGQLQNYGNAGDIALGISVSGNSPNCAKALDWARKNGLRTVALVGAKRGRMAEIAEQVLVINDTHYGRVEDAQMGICHMLCYAFMENPQWAKA
jgi:D-sedoheptulose 7-phosphate isomerase